MKRKLLLIILLSASGLMGWALGYLRLPFIEQTLSFWVGFAACLAVIFFVILIPRVWNQRKRIKEVLQKKNDDNFEKEGANFRSYNRWLTLTLAFGALLSSILLLKENKDIKRELERKSSMIESQGVYLDSLSNSNQLVLVAEVLSDLREELTNDTLSDDIIGRVSALSPLLRPRRYDNDTLPERLLSSERGYLLASLVKLDIDSFSFSKIKSSTSFANSDLHNANLNGADLSGVNLAASNLDFAQLSGANMRMANLIGSSLQQVNLNGANLQGVLLKNAYLKWAEMNQVHLEGANLNGADMQGAKLRDVNLEGALFQWANAPEALFNRASFTEVDMEGTNLERSNLTDVNFTRAHIRKVNFNLSTLSNVVFDEAAVEESWIDDFKQLEVIGVGTLLEDYEVIPDTSGRYHSGKYCLKPLR